MLFKAIVKAGATLGVGLIPLAPGTWGSLLAAVVWWVLLPLSLFEQGALIFLALFLGMSATHFYETWYQRHDPKEVVVDELVGMWITLWGVSSIMSPSDDKPWLLFFMGFLFFRLFDIWKPFPVGWIDRKGPGALGTMLDDVAAGVMAWITLFAFGRLLPILGY